MFTLTDLLILPTVPVYRYLRPVDLLQLYLCNRQCQSVIQTQKAQVRETYLKYYGPLLAAHRIKSHPYLNLKTADDYSFFFHEDMKFNEIWHLLLSKSYVSNNEIEVDEWKKALCKYCELDFGYEAPRQLYFEQMSDLYMRQQDDVNVESGELLAYSQDDFLLTLCFTYCMDFEYNKEDIIGKSVYVSRFGYFHDAMNKYGVEMLIYNLVRYNQGRGFTDPADISDFLSNYCQFFCFGSPSDLLVQIENILDTRPHFYALEAYFLVIKGLRKYQTIDIKQKLMAFFSKLIAQPGHFTLLREDTDMMRERLLCEACNLVGDLFQEHVKVKWIVDQIKSVKHITCLEYGWAVVQVLVIYKDQFDVPKFYSELMVEKFSNKDTLEEAKLLLMSLVLLPRKQRTLYIVLMTELFAKYKSNVLTVIKSLLQTDFVVKNADKYQLPQAVDYFSKLLVDHHEELFGIALTSFSKVHPKGIKGTVDCGGEYHDGIDKILNSFGGHRQYQKFLAKLDASMLSDYHECIVTNLLFHYCPYYKESFTDKAFMKLLTLYCKLGDPVKTAGFLKIYLEDEDRDENLLKRLKRLCNEEQLRAVCEHLNVDEIESLEVGDEYQKPWMKEIKLASKLPFPQNITKVVLIAKDQCGSLEKAPRIVQAYMQGLCRMAITDKPKDSTSRFYFIDGLPAFVFKEKVILSGYVRMWALSSLFNQYPNIPPQSELAHGFFNWLENNKDLSPEERRQMVKTFAKAATQEEMVDSSLIKTATALAERLGYDFEDTDSDQDAYEEY
ncbi:hypothetical protein MP228_010484 [Amoeboaphelidium protococcarum]|nr:hypothetical protein MP228_010484 [Amoeboaphelidium protococcarum]